MLNQCTRGAVIAAFTTGALLAAAPATAGETKSAKVHFAGLDLTSASGRATLERRVSRAADQVCGVEMEREIGRAMLARRCASNARASARPALELAYRNAADRRLAAQDVSVIVAP